jgi:MutS domain V
MDSASPPPDTEPRHQYESRLAARRDSLARAEAGHRRLGTFRLLTALATAAILWLALSQHLSLAYLAIPAVFFLVLVIVHSRLDRTRRVAKRAVDYYERALGRLNDHWSRSGETGERFRDPAHPYADDLDLFGSASLFQLLNTARTAAGESTLAKWLLAPAARDEILLRQSAVDELRSRLDLREDLALLGQDFRVTGDSGALAQWGAASIVSFPAWMRVAAPLLALTSLCLLIALFVLFVLGQHDPRVRIAFVVVASLEGLLVLPLRHRIAQVVLAVGRPGHDLALLAHVLKRLEAEQFTSPKLRELRTRLDVAGRPASHRIARLERLIELLDSRDHPLMRVVGPLTLWTTQLAMAIESWRAVSGPGIAKWVSAVGEMEALSSLACYAYEHPRDPFPSIADADAMFDAKAIAHPLLPETRSIRNDLSLSHSMRLIVISGSNMSGKSTLLRTTGVNTVLALAGAPVRAESLTLSPIQLGASIRINDSLQAGASRFYAEITRLRDILALADRGPVLFLLDELLNGTNSHDRRIGAEGVVRGLVRRNAIGMVTTHDLALAAIADSLAPEAANKHFEDHMENGAMTFDYLIRPGVVEKSNALELMRAVGLDVAIT